MIRLLLVRLLVRLSLWFLRMAGAERRPPKPVRPTPTTPAPELAGRDAVRTALSQASIRCGFAFAALGAVASRCEAASVIDALNRTAAETDQLERLLTSAIEGGHVQPDEARAFRDMVTRQRAALRDCSRMLAKGAA